MLTQTVPGLVCCRHSTGCLEHSPRHLNNGLSRGCKATGFDD
jgi:hypothetical protein